MLAIDMGAWYTVFRLRVYTLPYEHSPEMYYYNVEHKDIVTRYTLNRYIN